MKKTKNAVNQLEFFKPVQSGLDIGRFFSNTSGITETSLWDISRDLSETLRVSQNNKKFSVKTSVPGFEKSDIKVEAKDGLLTIHGEKKQEHKSDEKGVYSYSSSVSSFSRSLALPENALTGKIHTDLKHGVLEVNIPKKKARNAS